MKNLELLIQPLDLKLNDFDKEKQNFFEKYDVKILTEQNLMFFFWNRTNMETHESRTSESQQMNRDLLSKALQLNASAVPLNLSRNLEAKIVSQQLGDSCKVFKEIYRQHRIH